MKIYLGNFKVWRIRKNLIFLFCMMIAFILKKCIESEYLLLVGLILYGILIEIIDIKICTLTYVYKEKDKIIIENNLKRVEIGIKEILKTYIKEIHYGGKWLDVIGYRLHVITKKQNYHFDSVYIEQDDFRCRDIQKLEQFIKELQKRK